MNSNSQNSFFRILDAAANRASEGIRVAEDLMRMHLNDAFLAKELKQLRHDLATAVRPFAEVLFVCRDSQADVGRMIAVDQEYQRSATTDANERDSQAADGFDAVLSANFKRAQQAVRSIEEFCKVDVPSLSIQQRKEAVLAVEQLRYRCYTLEKACLIAIRGDAVFKSPSIYVLIDGDDLGQFIDAAGNVVDERPLFDSSLAEKVTALVDAKVDWIQLRDKSLSDRQLVAAGKLVAALVAGTASRFVINDRADLAIACGADGVHVGQQELSVADARRIIGPNKFIGVSTHSLPQAQAAVIDGADYIGIGPVFRSTTKSFDSYVGASMVQRVVQQIGLPAFAIGGIDVPGAKKLAAVGCQRVAVTAAFSQTQPARYLDVADQFRRALQVDQVQQDQ